jgi:hypothetical protein
MRISNVKGASQPNFIEVRQYENSLINIQKDMKPIKSDFVTGFWRVKAIELIHKEYALPTNPS